MAELVAAARTTRQAIAEGSQRLASAGCDSPRLDAEVLLAHALGHDSRARLVLDAHRSPDPGQLACFQRLLARRERREPVAYILGFKWFRGICVRVDSRVLIPRPETELLVEVALSLPRGARVADVGSGSGAVALALKMERPDLAVTGIEVSEEALAVARENRDRLDVEVEFVRADLLDGDRYDAVVANLPYVARSARLAPEIALYEPPEAVYAGEDGLASLRRLAAGLKATEAVRFAALEVGQDQARAARDLLRSAAFTAIETRGDLAGHERVVIGRR